MSHQIKYDRYFRVVTIPGDEENTAGIGVEEYNPLDFSDNNVLYFASIYLDNGGRLQAVRRAFEAIEQQVKKGEGVAVRLNGRRWKRWREIYPRFNITQLKTGRGGWCNMLAHDAIKRKTTIEERLDNEEKAK